MNGQNQARREGGERLTFDFIVVGAGPAGCAVAARLSQSSPETSVALIEAGPAKASLLSDVPLGIAALVPLRSRRNFAYETVPQNGLGGRKGYQPRGRGLGGSSLINAMIYMRGQPQDYDAWAALGCKVGAGRTSCPTSSALRTMRAARTPSTARADRCM